MCVMYVVCAKIACCHYQLWCYALWWVACRRSAQVIWFGWLDTSAGARNKASHSLVFMYRSFTSSSAFRFSFWAFSNFFATSLVLSSNCRWCRHGLLNCLIWIWIDITHSLYCRDIEPARSQTAQWPGRSLFSGNTRTRNSSMVTSLATWVSWAIVCATAEKCTQKISWCLFWKDAPSCKRSQV